MRVLTIITKRSCRETDKRLQTKRLFSMKNIKPGTCIEIIDGNKKSPACILESEDAMNYKQAIRSGELDLPKIKFSKTGSLANGVLITSYDPKLLRTYLSDPALAHNTGDTFLCSFFPKKRTTSKKKSTKPATKKHQDFSSLSLDSYFDNKPVHHSQMHELVDTIRNYFGETARFGQGSFSYYLGFFKKIPNPEIHRLFGEAKQSRKPLEDQKKIFWWKVGQYVKNKD